MHLPPVDLQIRCTLARMAVDLMMAQQAAGNKPDIEMAVGLALDVWHEVNHQSKRLVRYVEVGRDA
jgi:hypothetical protein